MATKQYICNKLNILRAMCIITKDDPRKEVLHNRLIGKTEIQIDNIVHDLIVGNKTLNQLLGVA